MAATSHRVAGDSRTGGLASPRWAVDVERQVVVAQRPRHRGTDDGAHCQRRCCRINILLVSLARRRSTDLPCTLAAWRTLSRLGVVYQVKPNACGEIQLAASGKSLGKPFDGYSPHVRLSGEIVFGEVELAAGEDEITIEVVDSHPQSQGYLVRFEQLKLVPVPDDAP